MVGAKAAKAGPAGDYSTAVEPYALLLINVVVYDVDLATKVYLVLVKFCELIRLSFHLGYWFELAHRRRNVAFTCRGIIIFETLVFKL